jgi:hypothetical protein
MQPAGALLGGVTGSAVGLKATLIISSAIILGGTAIAFASPLRTLRGLPAQQENDSGRRAA